jgi:23S rRNA G2445 N2-methylase RlmL
VDSSGTLLHKRGYRQAVSKAPLRETLAAALLMTSGWDLVSPLLDPFCGSNPHGVTTGGFYVQIYISVS